MSHKTSIRIAINQHGDSWIDYFSLSIDPITEFQEEFIPGGRHPDIQAELSGSKGLPREIKRRKEIA